LPRLRRFQPTPAVRREATELGATTLEQTAQGATRELRPSLAARPASQQRRQAHRQPAAIKHHATNRTSASTPKPWPWSRLRRRIASCRSTSRSSLCWPNVVHVEVDAAYWEVAEPPWSIDQAGPRECPLEGAACPAHCFAVDGSPVVDGKACEDVRELVACSREFPGISDGAACRERIDTGARFIFKGIAPEEPDFLGWRACPDPADYVFQLEGCGGQAAEGGQAAQ